MEMRREEYIKGDSRKSQTSDSGHYLAMGFSSECNKASISCGMSIYFPSRYYSTKSGIYYNFTSLNFIYFITTVNNYTFLLIKGETVVSFKLFCENNSLLLCLPRFVSSTKTGKKDKLENWRVSFFFFLIPFNEVRSKQNSWQWVLLCKKLHLGPGSFWSDRCLSPTSGAYSVGVHIQVSCPKDVVHVVNGACSVFHMTGVRYIFHEMNNYSIDYTDKPSSKYWSNLGGISPDVNTYRWLRHLKLSQLSPTHPFLRLPSWIKEEGEGYLESYNLTHTLETLISFYCMYGDPAVTILLPLELPFNKVNGTTSSRRYFWEEICSTFVQRGG